MFGLAEQGCHPCGSMETLMAEFVYLYLPASTFSRCRKADPPVRFGQ
jgi:hypothetical protein